MLLKATDRDRNFNKYEDKRVIARAGVFQNAWVRNLLVYKQTEDIEHLSPGIKNSIQCLINPSEKITVVSQNSRDMMSLAFLNKRATNKIICSYCGYWIYRNDFAEFQDRLKMSMLKGGNNDIQNK